MKKILCLILMSISIVMFVGCGDKNNKETKNNTSEVNEEKSESKESKVKQDERKVAIPSELPYNMEVLPADSIGCVYGNLTYTNNSQYVVTMYQLTVQYTNRDGVQDKTYYSSYDTILPGETSPVIKAFGSSDWKPLELEYKIYDKGTGEYMRLVYDYKLDELKGSNWFVQ